MYILSWIIWAIAMITLLIQIPLFFHRDAGVSRLAKRFAFLIAVGLTITLFTNLSKFHLIWWVPVVYTCNLFTFAAGINRNAAKFFVNFKEGQNKK